MTRSKTAPARLLELAQGIEQIAQSLAGLASGAGGTEAPRVTAAQVHALIEARRLRDSLLGPGLFREPAWDMMLALLAARIEGRVLSVPEACTASAAPRSTALRWLQELIARGLVERTKDPANKRRVIVVLSDDATMKMHECLAGGGQD
jgi:DNA-binding MarR family transcriptional regulator